MNVRSAARLVALACFALFLGRTFHKGWNIDESDFPNYYTAAVLVRHGEPLRNYYDWAWFQRQMNFAGVEEPLGTYIPQTPLTMLPLVPMAGYPVQTAKRIWLTVNLGFLIGAVWLLSGASGIAFEYVALVLFAGYGTLQSNFHLGQYYVFLLFLIALAMYFLKRGWLTASGVVCGVVFALKLYGAPFLIYFAAKRNWKAVAGMVGTILVGGALSVWMFGWHDCAYFLRDILPRAVDGEGTGNPYHPVDGTLTALLRHLLLFEAELNPHPLWNLPGLFFFLRAFSVLAILGFAALGVAFERGERDLRGFAWFTVAALSAAPNLGSYSFLLFFPAVVVLMDDASFRQRAALVVTYMLLGFPLVLKWTVAFPKLWIILALFLIVGSEYWRGLRLRTAVAVGVALALIASVDAARHWVGFREEPGRRFEQVSLGRGSTVLLTPSIGVTRAGIFCQVIGDARYVLLWLHGGGSEQLVYAGEAFHPSAVAGGDGAVDFELVNRGTSSVMEFDPATREVRVVPAGSTGLAMADDPLALSSVTSPDGRWAAFEKKVPGARQIWLRNVAGQREELLAGGKCNNRAPAWEMDSKAVLFTSDCQRGIGLPALYRAAVAGE
jgi:hypothetical protein